jgi:peptidoglycan hydrolase FlgJ
MTEQAPDRQLAQEMRRDLNRTTPDKRLPVVDKSKVDPNVLKAAQGFETMFLNYMMKVMRQTVPKNEMDLENPATEIYRGMLDSEYAEKAVRAGGVGLADQIVAYLEARQYNLPRGLPQEAAPAKSSETGGTHAGQPDELKSGSRD